MIPSHLRLAAALLLAGVLASCGGGRLAPFHRPLEPVESFGVMQTQQGMASVYTDRRTASGERFHSSAMTAAHKTWPMGTRVRVTHLGTGRSAIVRINDRGPFIKSRIIDLTPAAASSIGLTRKQGVARVKLERLK
ncbi:septal ring lytic transglycosylase RlpA family protein [Brevifollis gellanilyticus]|nr:septal ring lytic transglycosylase RlpA family protein [Brevifollis gellanilyticus]